MFTLRSIVAPSSQSHQTDDETTTRALPPPSRTTTTYRYQHLGDNEAGQVVANVGWEQEYFLVPRDMFLERPDLIA